MTKLTQEIVKITSDLIQIPTKATNPEKLQEAVTYVRNYFGHIDGMYVDEYVFNGKPSIVIKNFDGKVADVVLNGHLDVVPEQDPDQYNPKIVDGKLYGRGSADMKSGCAIMMVLMKEVLHTHLDKKIMLMLTTDEEVGGFDGVGELVKLGYTGKVILIPDGGSINEIVYAEKGVYHFTAKAKGKACHASKRWLGTSAVDTIIAFYHRLREILERPECLNVENNYRSATVNMTNISAGSGAYNIIPDYAEAKFDVRFTETYDLTTLQGIIMAEARKYGIEIITAAHGEVLYTDPKHDIIQKYHLTAKEVLGDDVRLTGEHGASDGRFFVGSGSVVILHQVSSDNTPHCIDEHSYVADYEKLHTVYKKFLFLFSFLFLN